MRDSSGRYVLSYNGEVYNYRQLRYELGPAWKFQTDGDTEVLLAGLVNGGQEFLNRAEGMWSFALWDSAAGSLLAARDRYGQKPLYYRGLPSGGVALASELSALWVLTSDDPWDEDLAASGDYLRYGFTLPGSTHYRDVHEVLPGQVLRWTSDGGLDLQTWYQPRVLQLPESLAQTTEALRDAFRTAVERRLVADVEVGAFLSGGVDSSLVTALATQAHGTAIKTFTIGFSDASYDESGYAARVATTLHTDHVCRRLDDWSVDELCRLVLKHVGQPFGDSSLLPTALVSRVAAEQVKVALSGDAGDELFCGYERYRARAILSWYTRLPGTLRQAARGAVRWLPEPGSHHSRSLLKKAHLFMDIVDRLDDEQPYVAPRLFTEAQHRRLAGGIQLAPGELPGLPCESRLDDVHHMMREDFRRYLPQDILVKVDRASMASSLEVRSPFLDSHLVELVQAIPQNWHRRGLQGKALLQQAFTDTIPGFVWRRRKQGFGVPVHTWFRGALGDQLVALSHEVDSMLNGSEVRRLVTEHQGLQRDHGYRLWVLFVYLLWKQNGTRPAS